VPHEERRAVRFREREDHGEDALLQLGALDELVGGRHGLGAGGAQLVQRPARGAAAVRTRQERQYPAQPGLERPRVPARGPRMHKGQRGGVLHEVVGSRLVLAQPPRQGVHPAEVTEPEGQGVEIGVVAHAVARQDRLAAQPGSKARDPTKRQRVPWSTVPGTFFRHGIELLRGERRKNVPGTWSPGVTAASARPARVRIAGRAPA
jgi:hypothetical protein